jgi:hypothetical protein
MNVFQNSTLSDSETLGIHVSKNVECSLLGCEAM